MANSSGQNLNLPPIDRRSLPLTDIPQVQIPLITGGAAALLGMGAITKEAAQTVMAIDQKNQETAAEAAYPKIFLAADQEIKNYQASTSDDANTIAGKSLEIYQQHMSNLDNLGLPSAQVDIIRKKMAAQETTVGTQALDFGLKMNDEKRKTDLQTAINGYANIVAGDPRQFDAQMGNVQRLIDGAVLNGAEKDKTLKDSQALLAQTSLMRLADLNPAEARAQLGSDKMNAIVSPQFKTALLDKLDNDARAKANITLQNDISNLDQARKLGIAVPRENIEQVAAQARASGNEAMAVKLEKYADNQDWAVAFSKKGLPEQDSTISEMRMQAQTGDLSDLDKLALAQQTVKDKLDGIKNDPWGYYEARGIVQPQVNSLIDAAPNSAKIIIAQRRLDAQKVSQLEGGAVTLPLLTTQEADQLTAMKDTADPKDLAARLISIGGGMTGDERRAAVRIVAPKAPLLAVAMSSDFDTAVRLIAGDRAKGEVSAEKVREASADQLKGVTADGTVNDMLHAAIYADYKQLALEKGDVSKDADSNLINQAVKDTVGDIADINVGGIADINVGVPSRVIIPKGMTAGQVEDKLGSITDQALIAQQGQLPMVSDGSRATAQDIMKFGRFLSAGDGVYAVQFPTGPLYRDDGRLYTIDINAIKGMAPRRERNALLQSRIGGSGAGQ